MFGCGRMADHIKRAHELEYQAVAPTEIDSMRGTYYLHEDCFNYNKSAGASLKPIFGIEFSVCANHEVKGLPQEERDNLATEYKGNALRKAVWAKERELGLTRTWRLCARAMNHVGLMNLYRLSSLAWTDGYFIRPRIDLEQLALYGEGLTVSVGGAGSVALEQVVSGEAGAGLASFERLVESFAGVLYLEVQPNPYLERYTRAALRLSACYGVPLLATNDVLYVRKEDTDAHQVILCLDKNKTILDEDAPESPPGRYLRSGKEMEEAFRTAFPWMKERLMIEAIERTVEVAARHDAKLEIDRFKALLPKPDLPEGVDDFTHLKNLCLEGWDWRGIEDRAKKLAPRDGVDYKAMRKVYIDRLTRELGAIRRQRFTPYFLIVRDLIYWARRQGIMVGPGRGSAAGSLICFVLGITAIDPIEHRLMFERFISPSRIDMPDIDMDFEDSRRQEVIDYLHQKYGEDRVAHIVTFTRLKGKSALRDVSRVLGIPMNEVAKVTNSIIERSSGDERVSQTVEDSFKEFKVCREFNAAYPNVLPLVKKLEGTMRQTGVHAAGIIVCGTPLNEVVPIERHERHGKTITTTSMDMWGCEAHGLLKLDVLGLRTLSIFRDAVDKMEERSGTRLDLETLPLNDQKVLDEFTKQCYVGIFQYDSTGAHAACEGIPFTTFDDVAALTALNRPGTMRSGLATEYKRRKLDPSKIKPFHPLVDKICEDTLGVLVYQEHVIRIFVEVGGYEPGTADSLRKKIAKKWGEEAVGKEREKFIEGAVARGVDEKDASKLMDHITFFGCLDGDTPIKAPYGSRPLRDFRPGDEIISDLDGMAVRNRVKASGSTGIKQVYRLVTEGGVTFPTASHWWKDVYGNWLQTSQLRPGVRLAFSSGTAYPPNAAEWRHIVNLRNDGMRESSTLQGNVFDVLQPLVQSKTDAGRGSSWIQRTACGGGEGLEERADIRDRRRNSSSSRNDERPQESSVEGRHHVLESEDTRNDIEESGRKMRTLRGGAKQGEPLPEPASASRSSQGQESFQQFSGQSRSPLSALPYGERACEGTVGRDYVTVISVEPFDFRETFDMEMEEEPANYVLANGLVSHNSYGFNKSHASAYGAIAYWGMFLKLYYPIEFMWALMKNEPTPSEVGRFAKECERLGTRVLPPDVNSSGVNFTIDPDDNIRSALVDIKFVGEVAITAIVAEQPFKDIGDFMERVPPRAANERVLTNLIKAGAMKSLLPNTKWALEEIKSWRELGRKKASGWREELMKTVSLSSELDDYSAEDALYIANEVSPLGGGRHPLEVYQSVFDGPLAGIEWLPLDADDFWDHKHGYLKGSLIEIKYNQVGDFHTVEPGEEEKRRIGWGQRYANVNLEDASGVQHRVKVDIDIFEQYRHIIDKGEGTCVAMHAGITKQFHSVRCHYMADLEEIRQKQKMDIPLVGWERCFTPKHPVLKYTSKTLSSKIAGRKAVTVTGVITHVKRTWDKRGQQMAFCGLQDGHGNLIELVVFASVYGDAKENLIPGSIVDASVRKDGRSYFLADDGIIRVRGSIVSV